MRADADRPFLTITRRGAWVALKMVSEYRDVINDSDVTEGGGAFSMRFPKCLWMSVILLAMAVGDGKCDEFKIVPSLSLRQEYSTNVFFDSRDEVDDFKTTFTPGIEVSDRTERMTYSLIGRLSPYLYWENSDLNATDQDYRGRLDYRVSPHLNVGAEAGFRADQSPDRALTTTGQVFDTRKQYRQRYGLNGRYQLHETTSASLAYSHDRDDPRGDDAEETMRGHSVNIGLSQHLGRWIDNTVGGLNGGFGHYDYETSKTKSYYLSTGIRTALTEKLSLSADAGARYVQSDFEALALRFVPPFFYTTQVVDESSSGWGGVGSAALTYQGLRSGAEVSLSHDIRTGSGASGPTYLTRLSGSVYHRPSAELTFSFNTGYFMNRADDDEFASQEVDEDTLNAGFRASYRFYRDLLLEAGYTFSYLQDGVAETESNRHLVFLSFRYSFADLLDVIMDMKPGFGSGVVTNPWPNPGS